MRMNIIGGTFIFIGLCLGLIAIFANEGGAGECIISIMSLLGGVLVVQLAQRQETVAPINDQSSTTE